MKTGVKLIKALGKKNVTGSDTAPHLGLLITERQERLGFHLLALCSPLLIKQKMPSRLDTEVSCGERERRRSKQLVRVWKLKFSPPASEQQSCVYPQWETAAVSSCLLWEVASWLWEIAFATPDPSCSDVNVVSTFWKEEKRSHIYIVTSFCIPSPFWTHTSQTPKFASLLVPKVICVGCGPRDLPAKEI